MEDHKQFYLPDISEIPTDPQEENFQSSPNITRTDKILNVKDKFTINDTEAHNKIGAKIHVKNVTANYTILLDDFIVAVSNVGNATSVTLPQPKLAGFGKVYIIKDSSGSAASTTITILPFASETIDGDTTKVINTNFGFAGLYTDGTNWFTA